MNSKLRILSVLALAFAMLGIIACDKNITTTTMTQTTAPTQTTVTTSVLTTESTADSVMATLQSTANGIIITDSDNITGDFSLPGKSGDVIITWASSHEAIAVIAATPTVTDGITLYAITINALPGEDVTVTLTGTFTLSSQTHTKTFTIRVKAGVAYTLFPTVGELYTGAVVADNVQFSGYVSVVYAAGYVLMDSSGDGLIVFTTAGNAALVKVGDHVTIKGVYAVYNTLYQVKDLTSQVINSSDNAVTITPTVLSSAADLKLVDSTVKLNHAKVYTVTVTLVENAAGNIALYDGATFVAVVYYNSSEASIAALTQYIGQIVTIDVLYYTLHATDGIRVVFYGLEADIDAIPLTEDQKFAADIATLEKALILTTVFELPTLKYSTYDEIQIPVELASNLSFDGNEYTVVRPTSEVGDVTGSLSITIKIGESTRVVSVPTTIKAEVSSTASDLFISEYIEGGSYNKLIEIYNATDRTIDLSEYTIELHVCGKDFAACSTTPVSLTLSGTLLPGQTAAIYNTGATADFKDKANVNIASNTIANFNGNDAIVLKHNGVVIDSIGQVGVNVGLFWGDATVATADMTLVRKSFIKSGDTNTTDAFDPSLEWTAYPKDTSTYVGSHTTD
jgi:predicted extracellular nuclease